MNQIVLPSFEDDKRRCTLELVAQRHAEEVMSLLGGDLLLLRDFYDDVMFALEEAIEENTREASALKQAGQSHADGREEQRPGTQSDEDANSVAPCTEASRAERDRMRNRWDVVRDFFRNTPTGRQLGAITEKVDLLSPPKDPFGLITGVLKNYSRFLEKVEPDFRAYAEVSGHEVVFSRDSWIGNTAAEEIAVKQNFVIFLDDQVLGTRHFRSLIAQALKASVLDNTPGKARELSELRTDIPPAYTSVFPDDIELWPDRISDFHGSLSRELSLGLRLSEAKKLGEEYHLDDLKIVMKTWLDRRAERGELRKGKLDGKVAYFA